MNAAMDKQRLAFGQGFEKPQQRMGQCNDWFVCLEDKSATSNVLQRLQSFTDFERNSDCIFFMLVFQTCAGKGKRATAIAQPAHSTAIASVLACLFQFINSFTPVYVLSVLKECLVYVQVGWWSEALSYCFLVFVFLESLKIFCQVWLLALDRLDQSPSAPRWLALLPRKGRVREEQERCDFFFLFFLENWTCWF